MIVGIGHIGILTTDIEKALTGFCNILGLRKPPVKEIVERKLKVALLELGGIQLEFLEDSSENGRLGGLRENESAVIHHFALVTDDIESDMARMKQRGVTFQTNTPQMGVRNKLIAFASSGFLQDLVVELTEP